MPKHTVISKLLKYFFTFGVFIVFGFLLLEYQEDLYSIRDISIFQFFLISLLILIGLTLNGSKLNRIATNFGLRMETKEWLGLSSMTTALNNIFFKAGSIATSNYLKKKYNFPYSSFAGTFLGDQFVILFIATFTGSILSLYLGLIKNQELLLLFLAFALATVLLFFLMRGGIRLPQGENRFFDLLKNSTHSFNTILKDKNLLYSLGIHNTFLIMTIGFRLYATCSILHMETPLSHSFLFAVVIVFSRIIPITYNDIGFRELVVGFFSGILGSGLKLGVLSTAVDRIFELSWSTLCTVIFRSSLTRSKELSN